MPGIPQVGNGSASISSGFVRGGGGKTPLVVVGVVGDPHAHAALGRLAQRAGTTSPGSPGRRTS